MTLAKILYKMAHLTKALSHLPYWHDVISETLMTAESKKLAFYTRRCMENASVGLTRAKLLSEVTR